MSDKCSESKRTNQPHRLTPAFISVVESNQRKALAVPKWSRGVVTSGLASFEMQIHFAKKGLNSRAAAAQNSLKLVI
jgi:hypothetical protein